MSHRGCSILSFLIPRCSIGEKSRSIFQRSKIQKRRHLFFYRRNETLSWISRRCKHTFVDLTMTFQHLISHLLCKFFQFIHISAERICLLPKLEGEYLGICCTDDCSTGGLRERFAVHEVRVRKMGVPEEVIVDRMIDTAAVFAAAAWTSVRETMQPRRKETTGRVISTYEMVSEVPSECFVNIKRRSKTSNMTCPYAHALATRLTPTSLVMFNASSEAIPQCDLLLGPPASQGRPTLPEAGWKSVARVGRFVFGKVWERKRSLAFFERGFDREWRKERSLNRAREIRASST